MSTSTDASSLDQQDGAIELEEGRYSRDDGGHVGYARFPSFQSYRASVCEAYEHDDYTDDDHDHDHYNRNDPEAQEGIMLGMIGIRESGMSGTSGGGYYDVDMDEYWAGPGPVIKLRGSL